MADSLEQSLKQEYQGKVFVIRNFWPDSILRYDSAGQLEGDANPGTWTLDGLVRIEKVALAGTGVTVQCKRLVVVPSRAGFDFKDRRHAARLDILLDLDPKSASRETVDTAFSRIFIGDAASFRDSVSDFWRSCVSTALSGTVVPEHKGCRLGPRIFALLGSKESVAAETTPAKQEIIAAALPKVGGGVTPPKVIIQPDPQYSEEARLGKFQGICVLSLVVDSTGEPKSISIDRPLGYGLDEQAVDAVEMWRFEPSLKDGKPVSVKINVEVTFRLR